MTLLHNVPSHVLVSAVRYALGRRTYIVSDTVQAVSGQWSKLNRADKTVIVTDVVRAFKGGSTGMPQDAEQWARLLRIALDDPHLGLATREAQTINRILEGDIYS
ncbi:hypothetical protein F8O06_04920 [Pseudoclavibacter sp. CFCC 14310]|uniref:hypothetical protein n=1 Tax=Pseudoclavibacter sp. CFCC 14310 TaxID=2615180 RepID=UPI0013010B08|nr:hypothetical protein [Pseudoclavibacter sp. CFCC 14310]KAB1645433.1 hypothetical protein F8O06_07525 [Pseudoclavibacter sp. CFCC 14310]KAB1646108.1 hypothetical protein F8O06_04920 [Pseudoclavibacter sp. CFCC 14310]